MGEAPSASKAGSTLAEETRILDAAFAELASGNQARAAQLIREHETRFPNGLLERERQRAKARLNEILRGE
jgi:TolA-binding protein